MQDEHQKRILIAKRLAIGVLVAIAIVIISIGVILLLKNVSKLAKNTSTNNASTGNNQSIEPSAPSADAVVKDFIATGAPILAASYQLQQDSTAPARITFKADDQTYTVSLSTTHYALFYAKNISQHNDEQTVKDQAASYLQAKGYASAKNPTAPTPDTSYTTYTNLGAVCQLTNAPTSTPAYYLIACADKSDVQKEYSTTSKLLDIYRKNNQLNSFTQAITSTITSGNKTMTTISLTTGSTHPILLFAALDNSWEYIGNVGEGSDGTSNGKYSLSSSVQNAIHNQKYGDFLIHNLQ
jgi:hypothetical protein